MAAYPGTPGKCYSIFMLHAGTTLWTGNIQSTPWQRRSRARAGASPWQQQCSAPPARSWSTAAIWRCAVVSHCLPRQQYIILVPTLCMLVSSQEALTHLLCHQVFCGMLARIAQFTDVLRDSRQQIAKVRQSHDHSL